MKATQSTFLGLEITKTSKGFEVKNSTDLVESLLNLYGLENSKPTANPGRRSVMELASATLWMVMTVPAFAQPSENPSSWHLGVQTCNLPSNNYPHKSSIHDREQARSETVDTISQRHATTLVFVLNRAKWFKKVCWNSLVVVTQIGPAIRQHAKVQRDVIAMHRTGHCATGV